MTSNVILNFRIEKDLYKWFSGYCRRHRTTINQMLTNFILSLRTMEEHDKRELGCEADEKQKGLTMPLKEYFDIMSEDDIRIKGTRIGIESVLLEYVHCEKTPEEIAQCFPTLSLEQVYATILYYLHNKEKIGAYLADYFEYCRNAREEYEKNPPSVIVRLRQLKAAHQSEKGSYD